MRSWTSRLRQCWLALLFSVACLSATPVPAQVRIAPDALINVAELDQVLRVGDQLEGEQRWGEALSHYEKALKEFPGRQELEQRQLVARFHYEVTRRYDDQSFVEVVRVTNTQQALDLYGEVLLKIHAHYVERPDWSQLLERGCAALEVAATEPLFLETHGLTGSEAALQAVLPEVRQRVQARPVYSRHDLRERAHDAAQLLNSRLRLPPQATIFEFTCAAVSALDDYSSFLTGSQLDDVLSQIEGNFVGLGIELKAEDEALKIVSVIPGGPADRGGLRPSERIVEVDGHSTREVSTDAAADLLKGPEGSQVELVVLDTQDAARRVRLQRLRVEVPSVERTELLDKDYGVAYFRLPSFQKTTSRDVDAALWQLHKQGMRSLIIDVRGNPGGLLTAAVELADKFVQDGALVSTRGRSAGEDFDYKAHAAGTWRVPLIVLIDGDSASASEIFAGAIHDHRRGTLVGTRTYGKGSVQGIFPMSTANVGVRLTTAMFYSPSGQAISHRGVSPDIVVKATDLQLVAKPVEGQLPIVPEQPDVVLAQALQVARQQVSQRPN